MGPRTAIRDWLLGSDEPWTRYRTRLDLLDQTSEHLDVIQDRKEMVAEPSVQDLIARAHGWPGYPLKRHNDAKHPIQALTVLADFGFQVSDPGMDGVIESILSHQSDEGPFETQMELNKRFAGREGVHWAWMGCDAPVLLYALSMFGLGDHPDIIPARDHLLSQAKKIGWTCGASANLGKFKGPGKRDDPCPIATLQALKALAANQESDSSEAVQVGIEMLLRHWEDRSERKYYLFGIGTDFQKLKYPLIWYDILHAVDVISRFPAAVRDPRLLEMVQVILDQRDDLGRSTASSMYMAWKGWSFANKKEPSPWLTFLVERIRKRVGV